MFHFGKKNKNKIDTPVNVNSEFELGISRVSVIALCDEPSKNIPVPPIKYTAKFLKKENNILTLIINIPKNHEFEYTENDTANVVYYNESKLPQSISTAKSYRFSAKILKIKLHDSGDNFSTADSDLTGYDSYVAELEVTSAARERPLREFYIADIPFEICYKEETGSYVKLPVVTVDSGGITFKSKKFMSSGNTFECAVLTGYEALPVSVKILDRSYKSYKDYEKKENHIKSDEYFIYAVFKEIDSDIRVRLAERVFEYQMKMRIFRNNAVNLKKFYKKIHRIK